MIEYVEQMIKVLLGDYFFITYEWSAALLNILIFVFSLLIIYLSYRFWKYLLFWWWNK